MKHLEAIGRYFIMIYEVFRKRTKWAMTKKLIMKDIDDLMFGSLGIIAFIAAELVIIFSCLLFYAWYRNAYVEITRSYVLRRTFLRFVEKVEYRRIRDFGYYERTDRDNNFEDGLYIDGPYNDEGYFDEGIELHSNWVNMSYVLGQLAFRIVNERWAEAESDEDQNLIQEYVSSGRAREICLEQSGLVFPENDNSPYKDSSEEDSSN